MAFSSSAVLKNRKLKNKIRRLVSYFHPLIIEQCAGNVSPYLEVNLVNGKYVLDTANVNYSHGALHWVFDRAFQDIELNNRRIKNALILGFGAGSVATLLAEKYCIGCEITGVERDSVVIQLAEKYFDIQRFKSLELICGDAYKYVETNDKRYDLIVVDIYVNDQVPKCFYEKKFLKQLDRLLQRNGILFFNKMVNNPDHENEYGELVSNVGEVFGMSQTYKLSKNGTVNNMLVHDKSVVLS